MEVQRIGDAYVLKNVDLAGGKLFAPKQFLRGLIGVEGFDRIAETAIDRAGVREQLAHTHSEGARPRRPAQAGSSRELSVLAELLVENSEVGEDQLPSARIPRLGGCFLDTTKRELVALERVEIFALKKIHVTDVAEVCDFVFAIVECPIQPERAFEAMECRTYSPR